MPLQTRQLFRRPFYTLKELTHIDISLWRIFSFFLAVKFTPKRLHFLHSAIHDGVPQNGITVY